ncbi:MAG: U32 family peptidase, partial [Candidatus Gracilibacteria bacterium]|nr:U32 family peptidase [Candidatus Gracilibacteria bacterium]MDD2909204.1 U32 family peptidase [Candidatus Gracilibacteria bacterium]
MLKRIVGLGFKSKGRDKKEVSTYIKELIDGGASEFFTGYNPPYWYEKYGFEVSPNGRFSEHEQITDLETLSQISEEIHKYQNEEGETLELFLNFNAWYYSHLTFPLVLQMLEEVGDYIDGIIVGNIGMLEYLKSIGYVKKINISTIMAVYNKEAIRFMIENYKINKIILSREVTIREIEEIVTEFPDMKFEVFGEGDFCRYNNGLCFAEHKYGVRDICTEILDNFEIKKAILPEYKKLILNPLFSQEDKLKLLDNNYLDPIDEINTIVDNLNYGLISNEENSTKRLIELLKQNKNLPNLFYDALQSFESKRNKRIIKYLKGLKYANANLDFGELELQKELEKSVKSGVEFYFSKLKETFGETNIKSDYLNKTYNRSDNLNIFAYLYFSKFPNIET